MPTYRSVYRKPEPAPAPAAAPKLTIDRKVTRGPSTAKLTKVSRPSAAKTVENTPRDIPRPPRESSDG